MLPLIVAGASRVGGARGRRAVLDMELTHSPTRWYIPQCGICRVAGIYEAAAPIGRRGHGGGKREDRCELESTSAPFAKGKAQRDAAPGKARSSNPARGKGKRGGYRYMYLHLEHRGHIHLLYLLDKDEQEDLASEQRKEIRRMVAELKGAQGAG